MSLKEWLKDISVPVYLLVMFFACSSWIDINGVFVQLPLMVLVLPEGWALPSYMTVLIQVANIGPLAYVIANRCAPNKVKEWPVIYIIIFIGAASCLLLVFFWQETTIIGGSEHSTALLTLVTCLALVDTTSSVVYLPYMAIFKAQYMTAFYTGEGLGGLLPGIVSLIQGVGSDPDCQNISSIIHNETTGLNHTEYSVIPFYDPPRFSVEAFFCFLFAMVCLSGFCFSVINFAPFVRKEWVQNYNSKIEKADLGHDNFSAPIDDNPHKLHIADSKQTLTTRDEDGRDLTIPRLSCGEFIFLIVITAWLNLVTNGFLPSIQSYSTLPYGNRAYTLAVKLSAIANPLACFTALFLSTSSMAIIGIFSFLGTLFATHQVYLAVMSPFPPWQGTPEGEAMTIISAVLLIGLFSYVKVTVASVLQKEGRKALLWCGAVTQVGSLVGAIIAFVLVNVLEIFEDAPPCDFE